MKHFADPRSAWLLLAMASTFAGNSFLISSLANVVVVERGRTRIGFGSHLRYGLVISVLTTLLGSLWILFVT
jgi:Na+/H+ antiporter NhaD/arsenite permease-like protein